MSIFNSLGSNYSSSYVWHHLLASSKKDSTQKLKEQLSKRYSGMVLMTYKGREALQLAFKNSGLPAGSEVGINGFTCYVVYLAVKNAGYQPVFIDIADKQTNFGANELQQVHKSHPKLSAVIIQNTLGYPADMPALQAYCRQNNLMIIEDLAHSFGAKYEDGHEAGTVGDFTMLSFSQDKPVDVVAGGAVIDRRSSPKLEAELTGIGFSQRLKNRLYPFWTGLIRSTYRLGVGRILHFGLKKLHLLSTPMSDDLKGLHQMSITAASLLVERLSDQTLDSDHRRSIAQIYQQELSAEIQLVRDAKGEPLYLRFPIVVNNRQSLVDWLRQDHIYIGDTWYDAPIGPKRYLTETSYQLGSCPNAEKLSEQIVNLPTHHYVTPEVAQSICAKIKQWQASQQKS